MPMEREYFDARFDGLEKLMSHQMSNMSQHIGAVSSNVKAVAKDLSDHKESDGAHGLGGREKSSGSIVGWIGVIVGAAAVAIALRSH